MINDVLQKVELHKSRAKSALEEIKDWSSINSEIFKDFEKIKTIDTFIYRFIKLQDMMGEKLFKIFLDEIGEYKDNMSLLDMLDKMEKFELSNISLFMGRGAFESLTICSMLSIDRFFAVEPRSNEELTFITGQSIVPVNDTICFGLFGSSEKIDNAAPLCLYSDDWRRKGRP